MDESNFLSLQNGGEMVVDSLEKQNLSAEASSGVTLYTNTKLVSSADTMSDILMNWPEEGTAVKNNIMNVYDGGFAENTIVGSNTKGKATMTVYEGGFASGGANSCGVVHIKSGGEVRDMVLCGEFNISNGGVLSGGTAPIGCDDFLHINVLSGGLVTGTDRALGVTVSSGGSAINTTCGDGLKVMAGGVANGVTAYGQATILQGADVTKMTIGDKGQILVDNACEVKGLFLESGGRIAGCLVQGGTNALPGFISDMKVIENGSRAGQFSAYIVGDASDIYAVNGGAKPTIFVTSGARLYRSTIDGASVIVKLESGASIEDCTIKNSGKVNVVSDTEAINTTVSSGGVLVLSAGAIVKGLTMIGSAADVQISSGKACTLDFDLNYYKGGVMINNMAQLGAVKDKGKGTHTYKKALITYNITLADITAGGDYALCGGLTTTLGILDTTTFSVYNTAGTKQGEVKVGTPLALADGTTLTLTSAKEAGKSTYGISLTVSGVETAGLEVTTGSDIVNAHDNLISLREALGYAKIGVKSAMGDNTITINSSVSSISIDGFAVAAPVNLDLNGLTLNITNGKTIKGDLTVSNGNIASAYTFAAGAVVDDSFLYNGIVADADVTLNGNTTLTISGSATSVINSVIAGAGVMQSHGEAYNLVGTATTTISGGQYTKSIYAGAVGFLARYSNSTTVGGTLLTVDGSSVATTISGDIYAGGFGTARVLGNAELNFKGSNLSVTGAVIGDSYFATLGGIYSATDRNGRYVSGTRTLSFTDFSGNFGAKIVACFDKVSFDSSSVNFTTATLNFGSVKEWDFEDGATASFADGIKNNFAHDTLNVSGTYGAHTVLMDGGMSGSFLDGFDSFNSVNLFGEEATWDSGSWKTASYELTVDDKYGDVVLNQLA